jgi:CheY-like chemotaxis protein
MKMIFDFIVVDDDVINNMICSKIIRHVLTGANVLTFTEPEAALTYIQSKYANENAAMVILLLDINMPSMDGWEFLDAFQQFEQGIKSHFKIYMLSSSVDLRDRERAISNENVTSYLEKPFTIENLRAIMNAEL